MASAGSSTAQSHGHDFAPLVGVTVTIKRGSPGGHTIEGPGSECAKQDRRRTVTNFAPAMGPQLAAARPGRAAPHHLLRRLERRGRLRQQPPPLAWLLLRVALVLWVTTTGDFSSVPRGGAATVEAAESPTPGRAAAPPPRRDPPERSGSTTTKRNDDRSSPGSSPTLPNGHEGDDADRPGGIIQVVETEVWDSVENAWKGDVASRWTNEVGHASPSPSEVRPPEGWAYRGDWKIVVSKNKAGSSSSSSSSSSNKDEPAGSVGDSMGWEYQFQYLRPPRRRRIWLRSLEATQTKTKAMPTTTTRTAASASVATSTAMTARAAKFTTIRPSTSSPDVLSRTLQLIRDDWNFKGFGFALFKSVIVPTSAGFALRLPLTVNFDVFDRHPEYPSVTSSLEFYYPWLVVGYLSASVHVEWVKWVFKNVLGLVPRLLVYCLYKVVIPLAYAILSALMLPFKRWRTLPSRPSTAVPKGFFWNEIAEPRYNSELSERVGCSISYRWSKSRGFEFRFQKTYSYMPTLSVYRKALSQTRQRWDRFAALAGATSKASSALATTAALAGMGDLAPSAATSVTTTTAAATNPTDGNKRTPVDWWQKHFASFGLSVSTPIPDPPRFTCSSVLSLSGLYWGSRTAKKTTAAVGQNDYAASATLTSAAGAASRSNRNKLVLSSSMPIPASYPYTGSPSIPGYEKSHATTTSGSSDATGPTGGPSNHDSDEEDQPLDPILSAKLLSRTAKAETVAE